MLSESLPKCFDHEDNDSFVDILLLYMHAFSQHIINHVDLNRFHPTNECFAPFLGLIPMMAEFLGVDHSQGRASAFGDLVTTPIICPGGKARDALYKVPASKSYFPLFLYLRIFMLNLSPPQTVR